VTSLSAKLGKSRFSGVPVFRLGELEDNKMIRLGRGNVISRNDLKDTPGLFPVYSSSAVKNGLFGRYGKFMFADERITWSIDGGGKFFYRPVHEYSVTNVCGWLKVLEPEILNTKYLYYVLTSSWGDRTYNYTVKAHPSVIREHYLIPVPSIDKQREIVEILDTFTALEAELESELESELEARRTQFSYLLDVAFDNTNIRKSGLSRLSDHGEFDRGNGLQKSDFSEEGVGCIHYGQIYTKFGSYATNVYSYVPESLALKLKKVNQGNLIVTTTSENIEDVCKAVAWLGEQEIVIGGHSCVYRHDLDPLFATYLFKSRIFQDQKNSFVQGTKVKDIKPVQIGKIQVYVPPMDEQISIGQMMRDFDAVIADAKVELPTEIAARRQQYEYYRSKILNLEELENR